MSAKYILEGSATGAVKAIQDFHDAFNKTDNKIKDTSKNAKQLSADAARIVRDNETPQERYNRKIAELAEHVKRGRFELVDAEKAAVRYRAQLENIGKTGNDTFGAKALAQIGSYAAGFLSLQAGIGVVVDGFREIEDRSQAAGDRVFSSLGSMGQLQQVATSPEDFQFLVGQSRSLIRRGIFSPDQQAQAADVVFAARNALYSPEEFEFLAKMAETRQVKPEDLQQVMEGIKKYQAIFGKKEAGSVADVAQKVFQSAGEMQSNFTQAAVAATRFGSEAAQLGFTDEEASAAGLVVEQRSPNIEEAGTRVRSFLNQIYKNRIGKNTLRGTVDAVTKRITAGETAFDVLKESRAVAGYNLLKNNLPYYEQQLQGIREAPAKDIIGSRRFISSDPELSAADLLAKAKGKAIDSGFAAERETLFDIIQERSKQRGGAIRFIDRPLHGLIDFFGGERSTIEAQATMKPQFSVLNDDERQRALDYLRRSAESNERIERSSGSTTVTRQE